MKTFKIIYVVSLLIFISLEGYSSDSCGYKFIVWGDSQFENPEIFEQYVRETELLKPAFVIHVGDMITGYTYDKDKIRQQWERFKKQIAPLTAPFYPTPGNHDVTTMETEPLYTEAWGNDKFYYSFDYRDSHFIILATSLHGRENEIPKEEMIWLKKNLEEHKNAKHIFMSLHIALFLNPNEKWNDIHNLLKQYPVRAVFAGNSHIYYHTEWDNIQYFIINTSGSMNFKNHLAGYSHGILHVSVSGDKVDYAVMADGKIFPPDAVSPDEFRSSRSFYQEEKTHLIPNTENKDIHTTVDISVSNRTGETQSYTLLWETDRYDFKFDPVGAKLTLHPGENRNARFDLFLPKGKYSREDLPKMRIESPYINSRGYETVINSYHTLFCPPEMKVLPLKGGFVFDGNIEDPAWGGVSGIDRLFLDKKGTPAKEKTIVKVLYDSQYLYIGVWGEEPNPKGLKSDAHGEIPYVFADDSFEFYLDPNRDLKIFYRFMVNPKGTILSSGPNGFFSFNFDVKTHVGGDFWSAEFKIPYSEVNAQPPQKGSEWGMNVRRNRQQAIPSVSEWSRMRGFPAQPQYFGILSFE